MRAERMQASNRCLQPRVGAHHCSQGPRSHADQRLAAMRSDRGAQRTGPQGTWPAGRLTWRASPHVRRSTEENRRRAAGEVGEGAGGESESGPLRSASRQVRAPFCVVVRFEEGRARQAR